MSPGRNDPCPCGSGRKFKRCHGAAIESSAPSHDDRERACELLARLADLPRFFDDMDEAYDMIWGAMADQASADSLFDSAGGDLFTEWVWFDFVLHTGQTLAEFALDKHATELSPGGRLFLRACVEAALRLVQVMDATPGSTVTIKDLLDHGRSIVVGERAGSFELLRHDVFVARIGAYQSGAQFEGTAILIPIQDKRSVAGLVRRMCKAHARPSLARPLTSRGW